MSRLGKYCEASVKKAREKQRSNADLIAKLMVGVITTVSFSVHAQSSVTLYGVLDSGIQYKTSAGINSSGHVGSSVSLSSSSTLTNVWGLLGSEDLGGGYKAIFQLESGFNIGTGAGNFSVPFPNDTNSLFDRTANVGINSPYGKVRLGRSWSSFFDGIYAGDPAMDNFGSMATVILNNSSNINPKLGPAAAISGTNSMVNGGFLYYWVSDAIKYDLPTNRYGFSGGGMYSFGGTAGSFQNKQTWSADLNWTNGTLGFVSGYFDAKDPTGLTDNPWLRAYMAGVTYVLGPVKSGFLFSKFRNPTTGANQNFYYVATRWQATPFLSVVAAFTHLQDLQNSSAGANVYKLGAAYYLSKSTSVYGDLGYADNKSQGVVSGGNGTVPLIAPGLIGRNQLAISTGIRKTF
jgi:predicted porin